MKAGALPYIRQKAVVSNMNIRNIWRHFKTITYHKILVMQGCFKIGLYKQGLLHDLSKYSPSEFWVGVKYYQGTQSPNNAEREAIGYSSAWLHHKGRNKHHYEYWLDYTATGKRGEIVSVPMPDRYIAEMLADRIAASKVYSGKNYTDDAPLKYYLNGSEHAPLHPYTREILERFLYMLAEKGEKETFAYIRTFLKQKHTMK